MNKLEILAPAGSMEALIAAVRTGADAVYVGSTQFGARASAKNFDLTQLKEAVDFCHSRGVKLYLTMNTLITDTEMSTALDIAKQACQLPIDAIIVQDVGFASVLHKAIPNMPLHGSTQMSVHTPSGAKLLQDIGFKRVVLSREMTLKEIEEVAQTCDIELEVFVHGALCMCVSGQCYFSAFLGSRSGNRGQCAQTCRLPFMVEGGTGNDLSLKDMTILKHLQEMNKIGVVSAKIEGRLKRPEYVASAVNVARQYYDTGTATEESCTQLKNVFSRSGFTDGYYTNNRGANMFGTRQKDDVISATAKVLNQIHSIYKNEYQHIPVDMEFNLDINKPAHLKVVDIDSNTAICVQGDIGQQAVNKPLDKEKASTQLRKTGGTPYIVRFVNCTLADDVTMPMSALNSLRRDSLNALTDELLKKYKVPTITPFSICENNTRTVKENVPLRVICSSWDIPKEFAECQLVFLPENTPPDVLTSLKSQGFNIGIEIFAGMFGREQQVKSHLKIAQQCGIKDVLVNNLGAIPLCKELNMIMHGGFRLNVMNTQSVEFFKSLGFADVTTSLELTLQQINSLGSSLPLGTIVYGKIPLMLTRNCPGVNSSTKTCKECGGLGYITDRKAISFPYKCSGGCTQIFNSVPLYMGERLKEIQSSDFNILMFTTENKEEMAGILTSVQNRERIEGGHTRGLYYKGVL